MELFHIIDDGVAHIRSKGLYRQAKVYRRGQDVFAGYGGGFVKLGPNKGTSRPEISWDAVEAPGVQLDRPGGQPRYGEARLKAA
jgi:hypothetical protein